MVQGRKPKPRPVRKRISDMIKIFADGTVNYSPELANRTVTVWDTSEERKIAGSAAPRLHSLQTYLRENPNMEVYRDQKPSGNGEHHVTIWNRSTRRKISGRSAPLRKNLDKYLAKHIDCEVYSGQEKLLSKSALPKRVTLYNTISKELVTGNARPYENNLEQYLMKRPHLRVAEATDYRKTKLEAQKISESYLHSQTKSGYSGALSDENLILEKGSEWHRCGPKQHSGERPSLQSCFGSEIEMDSNAGEKKCFQKHETLSQTRGDDIMLFEDEENELPSQLSRDMFDISTFLDEPQNLFPNRILPKELNKVPDYDFNSEQQRQGHCQDAFLNMSEICEQNQFYFPQNEETRQSEDENLPNPSRGRDFQEENFKAAFVSSVCSQNRNSQYLTDYEQSCGKPCDRSQLAPVDADKETMNDTHKFSSGELLPVVPSENDLDLFRNT